MFVAIDGIHGSGKSSLVSFISDTLESTEIEVHTTSWNSDPDWNIASQSVRRAGRMRSRHAFTLFELSDLALRQQEWTQLEPNTVILADRHATTAAARAMARGMSLSQALELCQFSRQPDYLVIVDLPVSVALSRSRPAHDRSWRSGFGITPDKDSLDMSAYAEYLEAFRVALLKIGQMSNAFIVDGLAPTEVTASIILENILSRLQLSESSSG